MRRTFKKTLAVLTAMVSLTVCVSSFGASATVRGATLSERFNVGNSYATAYVSLGYVSRTSYGASTDSTDSTVTNRTIHLVGNVKNGGSVINSGYSYQGSASCAVSTTNIDGFANGRSTHTADYDNDESTLATKQLSFS